MRGPLRDEYKLAHAAPAYMGSTFMKLRSEPGCPPMTDPWQVALDACNLKNADMKIIARPHNHMNDACATMRRIVLVEMRKQLIVKDIKKVCPLTEQGIRKILRNGR